MLWIQSFWQPIGLLQDNGVQSPIGLASVHSGCLPLRSRVKQETRSGSPLFRRQLSRFTSTYMYGDGCRASCRSAWFAQLCSYMYIYTHIYLKLRRALQPGSIIKLIAIFTLEAWLSRSSRPSYSTWAAVKSRCPLHDGQKKKIK